MKHILAALSLVIVAATATSYAQEVLPELVTVRLSSAYIPAGFDSNDRTHLVVEGSFPNSCYKLGPTEKSVDEATGKITILQKAYRYNGICLMMIVPFNETVKVGVLHKNVSGYKVVDSLSGKELGKLPVQEAIRPEADDHMYAIATDIYVGKIEGNRRVIVVQGELPGNCWVIEETRAFKDGENVITVLPIMKQISDRNCTDGRVPFISTADIPAGVTGRQLLHVRSLNGEALNKMVEL